MKKIELTKIEISSWDLLPEKNKKLILICTGIILLLISYFFVYMILSGKTEAMQSEIATVEPHVEQLREYESNVDKYEKEINSMYETTREKLIHYPNDVRPEDKTKYATALEREIKINVSSVSFGEEAHLIDIQGVKESNAKKDDSGKSDIDEKDDTEKDGVENDDTKADAVSADSDYEIVTMSAISTNMTMSADMSYWGLKATLRYILATSLTTRLNSLDISYDATTGRLVGNMDINKYYITGLDDKYYPTALPEVDTGTTNVFNSLG